MVGARSRDVADVVEVAFSLSILRPLDSLGMRAGSNMFHQKMESFPFLLIQFNTVDCLLTTLYLL